MRMNVGLVTYAGMPELTEDDRLLASALHRRGAAAQPVVWDDPAVRWDGFDRLVLRSCWDYHRRPAEFLDWIDRREQEGAPLWNPPALVRANAHKSYLRDLEAAGVPVLPTAWLPRRAPADLAALLAERGWNDAVMKPAVSASAHRTSRTSRARAREDQALLAELLEEGEVLVQPFAPEVARGGEWSFVFFGGGFSHSVLKRPAPGDFRVQTELGGSALAQEAPAALLCQARAVMAKVPGAWLYARVDGIERDGALVVLELELIEPFLFLAEDPLAPARFADAILTSRHDFV
jgi:hypothetical protein